MLFKQELAELILTGKKTQTRRPVKAGEVLRVKESPFGGVDPLAVMQNGRTKIRVGGDYAVQYKYGKPMRWWTEHVGRKLISWEQYEKAVVYAKKGHEVKYLNENSLWKPMRIRVTDIRRENVLDISHVDAVAEGFRSSRGFWEVWCGFYDKPALSQMDLSQCPEDWVEWVRENRPVEKYQAWAYTFELVEV